MPTLRGDAKRADEGEGSTTLCMTYVRVISVNATRPSSCYAWYEKSQGQGRSRSTHGARTKTSISSLPIRAQRCPKTPSETGSAPCSSPRTLSTSYRSKENSHRQTFPALFPRGDGGENTALPFTAKARQPVIKGNPPPPRPILSLVATYLRPPPHFRLAFRSNRPSQP